MPKISNIEKPRYVVKVGEMSGRWIARAFSKGRGEGMIGEAFGASADEAVAALERRMGEEEAARAAARRFDERLGFAVPSREEYGAALGVARLSAKQLEMLRAHARAGEAGLTAEEIARAGGYASFETANALYGKAGRVIGETIGVTAPASTAREGHDVQTGILASPGPRRPASDQFVWVMHPELREAVEASL